VSRASRLRSGPGCAMLRGASSMAEQRTFNPLVQGSTPWRPTSSDLEIPPAESSRPLSLVAFLVAFLPRRATACVRCVAPLRGSVGPWDRCRYESYLPGRGRGCVVSRACPRAVPQQSAAGVPGAVHADILGDPGLAQQRLPLVPVVMRVDRPSVRLAPYKVPGFPHRGRRALSILDLEMLAERWEELSRDRHGPLTLALRPDEPQPALAFRACLSLWDSTPSR
jgi:hypothetical protein